jgi:predicted neuraminidase
MDKRIIPIAALAVLAVSLTVKAAGPQLASELIFPLEKWHNHSSSIVELPDGDLMVVWFHGSGERTADDVVINAARWIKATGRWTSPFVIADTPNFPDTNCVLYLDSHKRLWLFWPTILANTWESALMNFKRSVDYQQTDGPPRWEDSGNILLIPKHLAERTKDLYGPLAANPGRYQERAKAVIARSEDKLSSRLGWFSRTHPIELPSGRMLLPLYSDGFSFGLVAISDDAGKTWNASEPIAAYGGIQPSIVRHKDGTLTAYLRDNGPPPKRIQVSHSSDAGATWTTAVDTELPNPGSSIEALGLRDGAWVIVYNDRESGRNSLAISLSEDEGKTWPWTRHIERDTTSPRPGSFHYPSIIQAGDGWLHVTYSFFVNRAPDGSGPEGKSIKHARFNVEWIKQGDPGQ